MIINHKILLLYFIMKKIELVSSLVDGGKFVVEKHALCYLQACGAHLFRVCLEIVGITVEVSISGSECLVVFTA